MDATRPPSDNRPSVGPDAADRLQEMLHDLVKRREVRHAVLAAASLDRSFRWVEAAGDAHPDGTPMKPDTVFCIASVTKLYIAAAVLKLFEQGRVDIATPIPDLLSPALVNGIHRLGGVDRSGEITVRHLLEHSSGLPDFFEERPAGEPNLFERLLERDFSWTPEETMQFVREKLTPYFPPQPMDGRPRRIRYSDTNYQLLISLIESVAGRPLPAVFDTMFYRPLGLKRTFHPGTPEQVAAAPATLWLGEQPADIPMALRSFGDLYSTADDMIEFLRALVSGRVFDRAETFELMSGNWNRFGFSLRPAAVSPGWPIEYGLGIMRFRIPRLFSPLRPVPAVIGHTGVSGSWLFYCAELGMLLAGTVDQAAAAPTPFRILPRLLRILSPR